MRIMKTEYEINRAIEELEDMRDEICGSFASSFLLSASDQEEVEYLRERISALSWVMEN